MLVGSHGFAEYGRPSPTCMIQARCSTTEKVDYKALGLCSYHRHCPARRLSWTMQRMLGPLTEQHMQLFLKNPRFVGLKFPDMSRPETLQKRFVGKVREGVSGSCSKGICCESRGRQGFPLRAQEASRRAGRFGMRDDTNDIMAENSVLRGF